MLAQIELKRNLLMYYHFIQVSIYIKVTVSLLYRTVCIYAHFLHNTRKYVYYPIYNIILYTHVA